MSSYAGLIESILHRYNSNYSQIRLYDKHNESDYDSIVIASKMTAYRPKVDGALFARVKEKGKNPYISVKSKYKSWFDEHGIPTYSTKSDIDFIRISPLDFSSAVNQVDFGKLAATICLDAMSFPKFGCCSRYRECSAAGKCLHDDTLYSSACEYRRNLEKGLIFYGK